MFCQDQRLAQVRDLDIVEKIVVLEVSQEVVLLIVDYLCVFRDLLGLSHLFKLNNELIAVNFEI